jgi:hypothetical protein
MANILMVYGTAYGQTEKIVRRMADRLTTEGHRVTIWKGNELSSQPGLAGFDAFLVAGSVVFGRHQRYLVDFVRRNRSRLNVTPGSSATGPAGGRRRRSTWKSSRMRPVGGRSSAGPWRVDSPIPSTAWSLAG